jgi:hypothetical protein
MGETEQAYDAWLRYQELTYSHITFSDNDGTSMEDAPKTPSTKSVALFGMVGMIMLKF